MRWFLRLVSYYSMYVHVIHNDGVVRNTISQVNESAQANGYAVITSTTQDGGIRLQVGELVSTGQTREEAFRYMLNLMSWENTITYHAPFMPHDVFAWCERHEIVNRLKDSGPVCMRFAIDATRAPFRKRMEFFNDVPPLGFKLDQMDYHGRKIITIQRKCNSRHELWKCAVQCQHTCRDFFTLEF
jgi:hypothetical protein